MGCSCSSNDGKLDLEMVGRYHKQAVERWKAKLKQQQASGAALRLPDGPARPSSSAHELPSHFAVITNAIVTADSDIEVIQDLNL
jgi:hypothetical protein